MRKPRQRARSLKLRPADCAQPQIKIEIAPPAVPHVCKSTTGTRCDICFGPIPATDTENLKGHRILDGLTSAERKTVPIASGFLDYFPDAIAEAAQVSWLGNEKHNPGEPLHHARGKSNDHADCVTRHLMQRGGFDIITIKGVDYKVRHSAALLWRAAALCQEEIEREKGLPLPRGATAD